MVCMYVNYGRDISRGIKSWRKSGRDVSGSGSGRPPRLFEISRRFGESRDISRLSLIFSLKSGRVGISSTFPDFWFVGIYPNLSRLFHPNFFIPTLSSQLRGGSGSPISMQNQDRDEKKSRSRFSVEIRETSPILPAHSWSKVSRIRLNKLRLHWISLGDITTLPQLSG